MRTAFIAGNWKMHKTRAEAVDLAKQLAADVTGDRTRVMVAPPFTALSAVVDALAGSKIQVGAQNMGPAVSGAHTGEVSPAMLVDLGVTVVILGHSERRATYLETDDLINTKVTLALEHQLDVILCVGETLEEREAGKVDDVVLGQLRAGLNNVSAGSMAKITIAYEPVWAIGTGKTASPEDANAVHAAIRAELARLYDQTIAENCIIQYGGSVKPGNVKALMAMEHIDGALVGGASLATDTFLPIVAFDS